MPKHIKSRPPNFYPISENWDIDSFPFYWVSKLYKLYGTKASRVLAEAGINITQFHILVVLSSTGCLSVSEIAERTSLRLPTVTKALQRLSSIGIVFFSQNDEDKRKVWVSLSSSGRQTLGETFSLLDELFLNSYSGFSLRDIERTNSLLQKLCENLTK
ncbi:MAG: MarR family transcriptional regulator [Neptuniibacter sp.]